jgi:DNA repair protein RecO (recombination protein O)
MLHKTKGIVLQTVNYSETSLIVKMYTRNFGLQSYMIKGTRSKNSKYKATLFQPLVLVDMVVSNAHKNTLQRVAELNIAHPYSHLPYDIIKSSIALFLNEVLYKALHEGNPDENLFDFIENSLLILDLKQENCSNFHICFMAQLSRYMGFYPQGEYTKEFYVFDLREGCFANKIPLHSFYLGNKFSSLLYDVITTNYESIHKILLDNAERKQLLNALILFYQLHVETFKELKSQEILHQVIE